MIKKLSNNKSFQLYLGVMVALMAGYIYLSAVTPNDPAVLERYNISSAQLNLVKIRFIIPFLIYWVSGIFSGITLEKYAIKLGGAVRESKAIFNMGKGVFILVSGLIISGFFGTLRSYILIGAGAEPLSPVNVFSHTFARQDVVEFFSVTSNYLNIAFPLIAFWFVWKGSQFLVDGLKSKNIKMTTSPFIMAFVALLTIAVSYIILVFVNPYRQVGNPPFISPTYYVSDFMIFTTIIIPYLVFWFFGIFALINITFYSEKVVGIVYKKFFSNISIGFLLIVVLSIVLQFLSTVGYTLAESSLSFILLLVYIIIFIQALGYVFIARGAGKLKSIEDVVQK